jgi:phenylacetate-CoA ligase
VLRKSELKDRQTAKPPLGGFAVTAPRKLKRLLMSPGPIFEPEGHGADWWNSARALFAAGFRSGDIVHNSFAYHLTPGGFILEAGAHALGCTVIPGGVGNTEQQVDAIAHLKPSAPDFLKILLDAAENAGKDVSSLKRGLVSGAALPSSLREHLAGRGVAVKQCYATAELGVIAYETPALEGMVVNESVIVEIVRPGTGDPVAEGEVGEVVVTSFNADYPMIRLATGDLSAVLAGRSPCGRTNIRIKGWMGTRRPDHQGQGHVRASWPDRRSGQASFRVGTRAAFGNARTGGGRDDARRRVRDAPGRPGGYGGRDPAGGDEAQGPR